MHRILKITLLLLCVRSAPLWSAAQAGAELELSGPKSVLTHVPFSLGFSVPEGPTPVEYRVVRARDGSIVADGIAEPGTEVELTNLVVRERADLPFQVVVGLQRAEFRTRVLPGWFSLLPPFLAIALALIFREVIVSLFAGIWLGAFFVAGLNPFAALFRAIDTYITPALTDPGNASIAVFSLMLGGMVGLMGRSGGTRGIVEAVAPLATNRRRGQLATFGAGLAIFFDDYANTLIVGNTLRPITDRLRISREKLAYLVDSTAAPVAAIMFVSTWAGYQMSLIDSGLAQAATQVAAEDPSLAAALNAASPFSVFISAIPYMFYPILALVMVFLVAATGRDIGPMAAAERRAAAGDGLHRPGAMLLADTGADLLEPKEGTPSRWQNAAIPVLTVILVVILGLYFDGRSSLGGSGGIADILGAADPFKALLWGSLVGVLVAAALPVGQGVLKMQEAIQAWLGGLRAMLLAVVILVLAWSLGDVTEAVGTAQYATYVLDDIGFPFRLLPFAVFVTAAVIAFATGTSWATMAILLPVVIPAAVDLATQDGVFVFGSGAEHTVVIGTISSVLAGAIFGDHCSPISDTTVMSSMASGSDHVDHVRTQLPYALLVAGVGMLLGDIPTAFGMPWIVTYVLGAAILYLVLRFFGSKPTLSSRPDPRV